MSHWTDDLKDMMEYEFELETETRYVIEAGNIADYNWVNHVVDVYDESGRARIRVKNGVPRLSLKVPLFSKDTTTSKTCIRLEYKPITKKQEKELLLIRQLVLAEKGAQTSEKFGAPLENKDGTRTWINRDSNGNWWIEADEGVPLNLPDTIKILGTQKSGIKV
ncbi:MAG: hypothetical protein HY226_06730 [Candidatus Vogelbacteria bacterium]|nr:hypothetical protein [Candidatus Vogelbacteria bacterium]